MKKVSLIVGLLVIIVIGCAPSTNDETQPREDTKKEEKIDAAKQSTSQLDVETVRSAMESLRNGGLETRREVAEKLGGWFRHHLGDEAIRSEFETSLPILARACQDSDRVIRSSATDAFLELEANRIFSKAPSSLLLALLQNWRFPLPDNPDRRIYARSPLGLFQYLQLARCAYYLGERGEEATVASALLKSCYDHVGTLPCGPGYRSTLMKEHRKGHLTEFDVTVHGVEYFFFPQLQASHPRSDYIDDDDFKRVSDLPVRSFHEPTRLHYAPSMSGYLALAFMREAEKAAEKLGIPSEDQIALALSSPDTAVRIEAARSAIAFGGQSTGLARQLDELSTAKDERLVFMSHLALIVVDPPSINALSAFLEGLASEGRLASNQLEQVVDAVARVALEQTDPQLRIEAVKLLGILGSEAESKRTLLTGMLGDANVEVRKAAANALDKIGG